MNTNLSKLKATNTNSLRNIAITTKHTKSKLIHSMLQNIRLRKNFMKASLEKIQVSSKVHCDQ